MGKHANSSHLPSDIILVFSFEADANLHPKINTVCAGQRNIFNFLQRFLRRLAKIMLKISYFHESSTFLGAYLDTHLLFELRPLRCVYLA